jgi:hypothetical protein
LAREKQWKLRGEGLRKLCCPPIILINWSPPWGTVLCNSVTIRETHTLLLGSQEHIMGLILSQVTPVVSRMPYCLWRSCDRASWRILIIKPTRCTNFSNFFWNETLHVSDFPCPSSGVLHCTHINGICHAGMLTACKQDQDGIRPDPACVQLKTPDDGQRNCR